MPMLSVKALSLALALLFSPEISYGYASQASEKGETYVQIMSNEDATVNVTIEGDDGNTIKRTVKVKANQDKKVTWIQKKGSVHYKAKIESGDAFAEFEFDTVKPVEAGDAKLINQSGVEDIVDKHQITYKTTFPIANWELKVYNPDGDISWKKFADDEPKEAGETWTTKWDSNDAVFMVEMNAEGADGRTAQDKRVPWSVGIPHIDVIFDSGKAIIKPNEAPKLDEAFAIIVHELDKLDRANEAVNANLTAQLYIAGYTDTVGRANDNKQLSLDRAKAIAKYMRDKGVWAEIYYAGMGERGLAVETPDSTDEARNRRAVYLLGVQPPLGPKLPSQGAWRRAYGATARTMTDLPALPDSYIKYKEKEDKARIDKFGGEAGDGSGSSGDGGGDDEWGKGDLSKYDEGGPSSGGDGAAGASDGGGGDEGPPPVEGKRGCSVSGERETAPFGVALGLLVLGGLGVRRRRRAATRRAV